MHGVEVQGAGVSKLDWTGPLNGQGSCEVDAVPRQARAHCFTTMWVLGPYRLAGSGCQHRSASSLNPRGVCGGNTGRQPSSATCANGATTQVSVPCR